MARIVVILSLCLAACDVGELPGATGDGGGSGDAAGNGCVPVLEAANVPAGHHNPPMAMGCMSAAQCHNATLGLGTGAPEFSYAGMLFKADRTTPYGGATIVVKRGDAQKQTVVASNGEFYMVPGAAGIDPPTADLPATTSASGCPNVAPMVSTLKLNADSTDGDCSRSTCHTVTGGQGPIFLQ